MKHVLNSLHKMCHLEKRRTMTFSVKNNLQYISTNEWEVLFYVFPFCHLFADFSLFSSREFFWNTLPRVDLWEVMGGDQSLSLFRRWCFLTSAACYISLAMVTFQTFIARIYQLLSCCCSGSLFPVDPQISTAR